MSFTEIFRAIFINISSNKFKVFLTSLGIIVGSLTIVMVVGIGKGSQASVEEQFKRLNVGTLYVMSPRGGNITETIELSDVEAIKEGSPSLMDITPRISSNTEISYHTNSDSSSVVGVMENFKDINNLTVEYGEFITDYDNERRNKVAVIGSDLADTLFEDEKAEAVGKEIIIKGKRYEVIGVLERLGDSMPGFSPDDGAMLPYQVAEKYVIGKNASPMIIALAKDIEHVASAIDEISEVLKATHRNGNDFMIRDAGSRLTAAQDSAKTMSTLLIAVATIVLIVGGIGIMNVLFVSVKERTKEIGILKAIGARKRDILLQFLFEAIIISVSGGIIGILLSIFLIPFMKYLDLRVIPSLYGYFIALVFSIATGTFFGYYPAAKAAALRPIEALNHE